MRVLFCNYEYPPLGGGGGVVNALLAEEMAKRHEITVLTSQGLGLPRESVENGVRIIRTPVFFRRKEAVANLLSMLAFIPMGIRVGEKLLRSAQFDVINTHFVLPTGPVGDALSRFSGIPNVLSLHGGDLYDPSNLISPYRNPLLRPWVKRLLRRADMVVGQSNNTLDNMRRFYTPEIEGIRIPLGIRKPMVVSSFRRDYGFKEDDVLLVTVGRLVARKAITQLIQMIHILKDKRLRLLILGTGPQEYLLKKETQRMLLDDQVLFFGHVEESNKFSILQICDIYVSTSQHEGFGLVFLEAMACGLPIVCYDHGGQTDFLINQETGYVVSLNDQDLFRKQLQLLVENRSLRKTIGENNKQRVEAFYIDKCALMYENVFDKAIRAKEKVRRTITV
ncbi:MAG TPA: glycosyltransferase family 4 protein [Thermodesulfobacteriota bacterium]|nr:glycosyltransferase family 4 protein [Thermodesulfobacteriota bacterium]